MQRFLFILVIVLAYTTGCAQIPFFQQYFPLRKNDALQVNKILQEKTGYIWFGTSNGLFKFDGRTQRRFTTTEGLPTNHITALTEDSVGRIWMGFDNGRLGFLEKNTFHSFDPPEGNATKAISDILFDRKGNLWFATLNDGLYYYRNKRLYRIDEAEGLPDLYIYDLAEDSHGNIWAGTDGGAAVCTLHDSKLSINVINYNDGLPDNIIRKIVPVNEHSVLLATEDAGIVRYDFISHQHEPLIKNPWKYGPVSDLILKGEKIWMACPQKGLIVYDQKTQHVSLYNEEQIQGLTSVSVLLKDVEENIWVGSKSGLMRTPGDDIEYIEKPTSAGDANVLAVTVDHQNNIWFSNRKGLYKRELQQTSNDAVLMPLGSSPFKNYTVISLYTDYKGYIWAGLYGEGVLRIDPVTGKIKHLSHELRNGNILNITGKDAVIWLATLGGSTRITISEHDELDIRNFSTSDGLISDFIYQILIQNDRVWFTTDGKGVGMMDESGFHHFDDGLPNAVVYGMVEDANHMLWANVQGHGLYIFDGKKFNRFDSTLRLRDNDIHCLASDQSGNIVVMHDVGIDVIDVRKKKIVYLGEEVGLHDKIANLNAVGKDSAGHIFFGSNGGIIKYNGEQDYMHIKPQARIENFSVFDAPVELGLTPELKYDENNITVNFLGLWYKNPDGLFYTYKLENFDRDWIATTNRAVTYSRLPPGEYTFKVKTSETQNFADAPATEVTFSIDPPLWQTMPFYVSVSVLVGLLIYGYIYYRERKLRHDNELLEMAVKIRTLEIQRQNDEIQTQSEEISAQSEEMLGINENLEGLVQERTAELERKNTALEEYAFINAHKLRSPVATILGLINLISKTKLDHEGEEINKYLQNTVDELDGVVSSITKAIERGERRIPKIKGE